MDRNIVIALVLTLLIVLGWDVFILGPQREAREAWLAEQQAAQATAADTGTVVSPMSEAENLISGSTTAAGPTDRTAAMAQAPGRLSVETPELTGSINLRGLFFDDLTLKNYRAGLEDDAPPITVLSPASVPFSQYMRAGLRVGDEPDAQVVWTAPEDAVLTPDTPVTLSRTTATGAEHQVTLSVDEQFLFTVEQTVVNRTGGALRLQPYGATYQKGVPQDLQNFLILFEGPLGVAGQTLFDRKYKKLQKNGGLTETGVGGWAGITDKYWLTAAIPPQDQPVRVELTASDAVVPLFSSFYSMDAVTVQDGQGYSVTSHLFAGAKEVEILRDYRDLYNIHRFDWAVDWGNFSFLTRPIFNTLSFFHGLSGNWGVAILLLTLVIKAILFPLANLSYKSMAGMKKVQPEMVKIRERYADDKVKQQQEMMALYKKYKINPAAGCLPILAQMPIFYALYKTLFVTIELRHERFLYIPDLSEQDPTTVFNLFGLLPFDPTALPVVGAFLGLGILPLLMGAAMYVQTKLNPPPPDPMQRRIFALMPLIFMFIFAPFAAGLVLYWFWNTALSVLQQYVIMKRQGADVDILGNIRQSFGGGPSAANENKAK